MLWLPCVLSSIPHDGKGAGIILNRSAPRRTTQVNEESQPLQLTWHGGTSERDTSKLAGKTPCWVSCGVSPSLTDSLNRQKGQSGAPQIHPKGQELLACSLCCLSVPLHPASPRGSLRSALEQDRGMRLEVSTGQQKGLVDV